MLFASLPPGNHVLRAKATDRRGASSLSEPIYINGDVDAVRAGELGGERCEQPAVQRETVQEHERGTRAAGGDEQIFGRVHAVAP